MKYTKEQLRDALKWADDNEPYGMPIIVAAYRDQKAMADQLKAALDKALEENLAMRGKPALDEKPRKP